MSSLPELFIIVLVVSFLGSLLAGSAYLVRVRGKSLSVPVGDKTPLTKFRVPDWQYAVVCGAGVLFVIGASFPIETYLGTEESFYWTVLLTTGLLIAALAFLVSWLLRRSSVPVPYSRWTGPVAVALILGAFCSPCLVIPAGVRGSKERVRRERAEQFALNHPVAKLLISGTREAGFKAEVPSARLQESESSLPVGHRRYRNENSAYDFLDERLMSIEWRETTENAAFRDFVAEISTALGPPVRIPVPGHLVEQGVNELFRWESADADLEIEVAAFDSTEGKTEFGASFIRRSEARTMRARMAPAGDM